MINPIVLLKDYHAALNAFDMNKVQAMFAEEAVYLSAGLNGRIVGRTAIMLAMGKYFEEFTDQISEDELLVQLSALAVLAQWTIKASSKLTEQQIVRFGLEIVKFNEHGYIEYVSVIDDLRII